MRITLVISSLYGGGAERVMSIMANYWAEQGQNITLITLDNKDTDSYSLNPKIRRIPLGLKSKSLTFWSAVRNNYIRLKGLRMEIRKSQPSVVISFSDRMNVLTLVAAKGLSIPVVVSEHIDPRELPPGGIWNVLRRWTYRWASAVVTLTNELKGVVTEFLPSNKVHVIPNPALPVGVAAGQNVDFNYPSPFLVAMGRLCPQKGFDMLIEAFSLCTNKAWSLVILGEGVERELLISLTKRLGLESRVYFPGRVSDPYPVLYQAKLFVLSSRFEGFPMALLEAMSCGLPVVSFECPTGPSDIITDGFDGVLVQNGNVKGLANAINKLIDDEEMRNRMGKQAPKVVKKFSLGNIMEKWESLIDSVAV